MVRDGAVYFYPYVCGRSLFTNQRDKQMSELYLGEVAFRLVAMGEQTDAPCRQNPRNRCAALDVRMI